MIKEKLSKRIILIYRLNLQYIFYLNSKHEDNNLIDSESVVSSNQTIKTNKENTNPQLVLVNSSGEHDFNSTNIEKMRGVSHAEMQRFSLIKAGSNLKEINDQYGNSETEKSADRSSRLYYADSQLPEIETNQIKNQPFIPKQNPFSNSDKSLKNLSNLNNKDSNNLSIDQDSTGINNSGLDIRRGNKPKPKYSNKNAIEENNTSNNSNNNNNEFNKLSPTIRQNSASRIKSEELQKILRKAEEEVLEEKQEKLDNQNNTDNKETTDIFENQNKPQSSLKKKNKYGDFAHILEKHEFKSPNKDGQNMDNYYSNEMAQTIKQFNNDDSRKTEKMEYNDRNYNNNNDYNYNDNEEEEEEEGEEWENRESIIDYNDIDLNLEDVVEGENNRIIIETMEHHYIKYAKSLEDKLKDASSKMVTVILIKVI